MPINPIKDHVQRNKVFSNRIKYKSKFVILSLSLVLFSGCATIYNPATERKEIILINTKQEIALGKDIANQIKREYRLVDDQGLSQRIERIGRRVASVCDRKDLDYHFYIIEDKELNAFAIPSGYVYVNSGLVKEATDSELASVLGHEIGHIAARHPVKKLETGLGYEIALSLLLGRSSYADIRQGIDVIFNLIALGYSRSDEKLADRLGVRYAYKAGYEPEGMITFFKKLQKEVDRRGPELNIEFLKSHPDLNERIRLVEEQINLLKKTNETNPALNSNTTNIVSVKASPQQTSSKLTADLYQNSYREQNPIPGQKLCPVCKTRYPSWYNFCPKDGSKLISK